MTSCAPLPHATSLLLPYSQDGGGTLEYHEIADTIKHAEKRRKDKDSQRYAIPPEPELPHSIQNRKKELLSIQKQYEKQIKGHPNAPQSFEAALRLYYPKDDKAMISVMIKYLTALAAQRKVVAQQRMREADTRLLIALDANGDGKIQLSEFCELSKATGFDRVKMREKFRHRDLGNVGELSMDAMKDVLNELRDDAIKQQAEGGGEESPADAALRKRALANSSIGRLVAQAGLV